MSKLFSIVIPTYRHGPLLTETLVSVLAQEYLSRKIVIVNVGALNNNRNLERSCRDHSFYREQENRGVTSGHSVGIRYPKGSSIASLNGKDFSYLRSDAHRAEFQDSTFYFANILRPWAAHLRTPAGK